MRRVFASLAPLAPLALALAITPHVAWAQQMKPFKIEGQKITDIKTPAQPSWKITKADPYKVATPPAPKTYGGQPIIKAPAAPAPARKASASKKSASSKAAARKSAARTAPAPRRAVAPRPAPPPASPLGFGRGRGRLLRIR